MKQFSLAPLKYKIVTAFLSGCVALLSAYFISNYVFNETFGTLDSFSDLNPKLVLIERLFPEINRLDKAQRLEALRSPIRSMKNFQNSSVKILNMLDSLDLLCNGDTLEVSRIKQMRKLLSDRNNTFINYLELYRKLIRSSSISRDLKKISEDLSVTLKRADSTIVRTSVKTTTTTSIVDIPEKDIKPVKRSFFKKLFAREKTAPKESKPAQRKVITQKIVQQTDTYNIARKDNFSEDLDKTIESIEAKQRVRGSKLLQEEIKLATANAHFIDQLQALLQQVQNDEIREVRERTGSLENIFNEAYAKAGSVIFVFLVLTLLLIALMFIDISKSDKYKKQLLLEKEKAQELEQVKQRFLSNMSHELRTPLQAILGFSEQLKKNDGLQKKALQVIETSSAHLLHLVNEVLDYNRIVSDKFTLSKDEFELANVLGEIADVIDAECEKKGIKFNFH
ncbi:MAG: HAMP domain-containing histidine kinase, partial [Bacteroidia bacterium]|nr:HAMP domain-containing histidine kinase [Bacteroidia bacterium]